MIKAIFITATTLLRKKGISDPNYADPKWVDHDVPMGKKAKQ